MIVNVSDIINERGAEKEFSGEVKFRNTVYQGDKLSFLSPFDVEGKFTNGRNYLYLSASIHGEIVIPCSRCLEPYTHKIDQSIFVKLSSRVDIMENDDPDLFTYTGNRVELDRIVYEYTLLKLPIKRVCSSDCKGLCPKCGTNLNRHKCNCDRDDDIDIRLLELKKLLPSDSEEV